jgi:hypothetical protein
LQLLIDLASLWASLQPLRDPPDSWYVVRSGQDGVVSWIRLRRPGCWIGAIDALPIRELQQVTPEMEVAMVGRRLADWNRADDHCELI